MPFDADDLSAAEELNRLWDERNLSSKMNTGQSDLVMLDRLVACDDAPVPDKTFADRLRASLLAMPAQAIVSPRHAIGIVRPMGTPWLFVSGRRIAIAAALAACLTLIVSAGGGFLRDQANAPTVASVLASPAGTPIAGPTMTAWLESTAFTLDHETTLLPEIAATATGEGYSMIDPTPKLTVVDIGRDGTGRPWLLVRTHDGRVGWLPRDVGETIGKQHAHE